MQQYLIGLNQQKHKLRNLKNNIFSKLREEFGNEIVNHERDINFGTFGEYIKYHNSSLLVKNLIKLNEAKNEQM